MIIERVVAKLMAGPWSTCPPAGSTPNNAWLICIGIAHTSPTRSSRVGEGHVCAGERSALAAIHRWIKAEVPHTVRRWRPIFKPTERRLARANPTPTVGTATDRPPRTSTEVGWETVHIGACGLWILAAQDRQVRLGQ